MATAEYILNKSKTKKRIKFQVTQRRAWDYLNLTNNDDSKTELNKSNKNQSKEKINNLVDYTPKKNSEQKITKSVNIIEKIYESNSNDLYENIDTPRKESVQKKILTLTGHQKQIMRLITRHIKSKGGAPYTLSIFPHMLAAKIKTNVEVTRVSLKRLVKKNLLIRLKGEKGRNGCCKFKILEDVIKVCFTLFNDSPCDINIIENTGEKSE